MHDVIIPARNENLTTLLPTIWAFRQQPTVNRVIVVNDGLSAGVCFEIAAPGFATHVTLGPKIGKGQAIKRGLQLVTAGRVVFCDGDLHGFTSRHARLLTPPYAAHVILGVTDPLPDHPPRLVPDHIHTLVTGERSMPIALVRCLDLHGYCVEVQVNAAADRAKLPVEVVNLDGCRGTSRWTPERVAEMKRDGTWLREHGA